jgi:hypothetical protein
MRIFIDSVRIWISSFRLPPAQPELSDVPGNDPIDISDDRKQKLDRQLDAQLKQQT